MSLVGMVFLNFSTEIMLLAWRLYIILCCKVLGSDLVG